MQSTEERILFKWIMRNTNITIDKDVETIDLTYPVTMEEIALPVRNVGCTEMRTCVWPLGSLMKEIQEDVNKGVFKEYNNYDITNSSFSCRMCLEQTKFAKRSYRDFYYDRRLDYLIRVAKVKFMELVSDQGESAKGKDEKERARARKKIERGFKSSKLILYRGGGAVLEYKKKVEELKVTLRAVVVENTLSHYSQQLVFNPKDYARNLSALKLAQNLSQKRIGQAIQKGFEDTEGCYSQKYRTQMKELISTEIKHIVGANVQPSKKQELYAAKMVVNQSTQNRKAVELILFYPRYNLTQIYTFDQRQDVINSCNKQTIKILKLPNHHILLYTADFTYILELEPAKQLLYKNNIFTFQRPIVILDEKTIPPIPSVSVEIKYLKHKQYNQYPKAEEKKVIKFDSVKPLIDSPILLANPENPSEIFVLGGTIQGTINEYVYRLERTQQSCKWVRQETLIKLPSKHCQLILEGSRIFLLSYENVGTDKAVRCRLALIQLDIFKGVLGIKGIKDLQEEIGSQYLLPLRSKDKEYILTDLTNKQLPLILDLSALKIVKKPVKEQIRRFIKQLYDSRNQRSIFQSYPSCSVTHNQITYNLLSYSITKHTFKIYYGCGDEWMVSELSQTLIHD